jgi:hypothetical protein
MRTTMLLWLAAASLPACKWTEFDDLEDQTWVGSTKKPDVTSVDYGVAIQRGGDGRLVVIGSGPATYSELTFDAKGASSLAPTTVDLNAQFNITTLDPQPLLLADPSSNDVALIVNGGSAITVVTGAQGTLTEHQIAIQPSTVDAATYMQAPPRTDLGHLGEVQPVQPLVASGDVVVGTFYMNTPSPQPKCKLTNAGAAVQARALGTVRNAMVDDVLAWGADGKLYRYPASVFNGCITQDPVTSVDTGFMPGHGSQILAVDATHVLLQGHHETDDASMLQLYDVGVMPPVAIGSSVVKLTKLRTATILDLGGTRYAIAGLPTESVDSTTAGGVQIYKLGDAGLDALSATPLSDAQPEANQAFGRGVAVMPFQGKQVIAVAADNEIFVYFRAQLSDGTPLYPETRQGR